MKTTSTPAAAAISGLLLAGGLGRRMGGSDKGLLPLDGESLAARVLDRLRPQVGPLIINANRNLNAWQGFGVPVVSDVVGGFSGPLAGMHAGLTVCTTPWLATVPCDSPFLPADLVQRLAAQAGATQADLAVVRTADGLQPVFCLLRSSLRASLEAFLGGGGRKIADWLATVRHVEVDFPDAAAFANINTPDELAGAGGKRTSPAPAAVPRGRDDLSLWAHQSVLVVDDEPGMVSFLQRTLEPRCGSVGTAGSVEDAERLLARQHYDLIVLDISLPGRTGVQWLHQLREQGYAGDVVLMTAYADLDTAIDALRAGAADFLLKPFSVAQMLNAAQRCFERSSLKRQNYVLRRQLGEADAFEGLVGASAAMREVCELIQRVAPTPSTVLIQGESGTGKELAARALHRMSPRATHPFVPINCAAVAAELIESELFGHVKGAYTGAAAGREGLFYYARGGTLFLDEVSELPLPLQAKLLRVLEERKVRPVGSEQEVPVDVRMVAATNRDLTAEVAAGRFRQDLFYRLQVVCVNMPPLRRRIADLPDLVAYFNAQLAARLGVPPLPRDEGALTRLARYDWPGNVRELRNLVERSLIVGHYADDPATGAGGTTGATGTMGAPSDMGAVPPAPTFRLGERNLDAVERHHILAVLAECGGNKTEAARRLGISRKTLDRKCVAWGVS